MVDNKEFIFPEIAAFECQTGHSTTGLVSAPPPSKTLLWPVVSLRQLSFVPAGFLLSLRCRERSCHVVCVSAVPVQVVDVKTNVDDVRRAVSARIAHGLESLRTTRAALDGVCTGTRTSGFEPSRWD